MAPTFESHLLEEQVGVSEKVSVHLQQGSTLENERGQGDLGQVHSYSHLGEQVSDDTLLVVDVHW